MDEWDDKDGLVCTTTINHHYDGDDNDNHNYDDCDDKDGVWFAWQQGM